MFHNIFHVFVAAQVWSHTLCPRNFPKKCVHCRDVSTCSARVERRACVDGPCGVPGGPRLGVLHADTGGDTVPAAAGAHGLRRDLPGLLPGLVHAAGEHPVAILAAVRGAGTRGL